MPMSYDAPPDAIDQELVLKFFWKYSTFECELKRRGFLKEGESWAKPDWKKFVEHLHRKGGFKVRMVQRLAEAIEALKAAPPRRQVVKDGQLGWEDLSPKPGDAHVLKLLMMVRNNLFHGGKYLDGHVKEIARDSELLRAALTVLEACFELLQSEPGAQVRT